VAADIPVLIALIFLTGVASQLLARRLQVPSVLFLIIAGLVLGEAGLQIVTLETFGIGENADPEDTAALSTVVGLSVAIIVFDGAFQLRRERLREASTVTLRLITAGALLTLVGVALAVKVFLGESWSLSFLVGALLVATGPTVITPILEVVPVREHVASALEAEGVINDVSAAIAAVVIFEVFVEHDGTLLEGLVTFLSRFGIGIAAGIVSAGIVYVVLVRDLAPGNSPQVSRFLFVSAALGAFAMAEAVAAEAGIAAAATSGILLGNAPLPHRETMEEFGRDVTLLVLAFVFISLAAFIKPDAIRQLGLSGVALVVAVVLVIRPLAVFVATVGVERFSYSERYFMGALGPRGIVVAAVATLFAIELRAGAETDAVIREAQQLEAAVFLIIFVTVFVQGGFARQVADYLDVSPMPTIIVGGGRVGRALATRLERRGEFVVIVDNDDRKIEAARDEGFTVRKGDGTEPDVLREAGIEDSERVVAATSDDDTNLLVCQLATSKFEVEDVFARVNKPQNVDAFDALEVTAVDSPTATAVAVDNEIERPAMAHWMSNLGDGHDVQEVTVTSDDVVGQTISEVNAKIPAGCIVAVIAREGESHVPSADERIERDDRVTFIGEADSVDRAVNRFHPHE
jgi:NhaP-type Na+/H+ or K+/H+ antiporter